MITKAEMTDAVNEGMSARQLADHFGVTINRIYNKLRQYKLRVVTNISIIRNDEKLIRECYAEGMNEYDIADTWSEPGREISPRTVKGMLLEWGVYSSQPTVVKLNHLRSSTIHGIRDVPDETVLIKRRNGKHQVVMSAATYIKLMEKVERYELSEA